LDEKNFALNRAGGLLATDMPNAKAERLAPEMPSSLFEVIHEVDAMFFRSLWHLLCLARQGRIWGSLLLVTPHNLPVLVLAEPKNAPLS
jgi:hypothetical protein